MRIRCLCHGTVGGKSVGFLLGPSMNSSSSRTKQLWQLMEYPGAPSGSGFMRSHGICQETHAQIISKDNWINVGIVVFVRRVKESLWNSQRTNCTCASSGRRRSTCQVWKQCWCRPRNASIPKITTGCQKRWNNPVLSLLKPKLNVTKNWSTLASVSSQHN
jgi:hypothetical protein